MKRFIAGARCPSCQEIDTVYVLKSGDPDEMRCVNCDLAHQKPGEWVPIKVTEINDKKP